MASSFFDQIVRPVGFKLGLRYYPKLAGMSPVSPVQGYGSPYLPLVKKPPH